LFACLCSSPLTVRGCVFQAKQNKEAIRARQNQEEAAVLLSPAAATSPLPPKGLGPQQALLDAERAEAAAAANAVADTLARVSSFFIFFFFVLIVCVFFFFKAGGSEPGGVARISAT
jgi:hypothetical protein